ncbi:MAG: PfkB family carbohydrate kinase [Elusimicrobiota bacterium]
MVLVLNLNMAVDKTVYLKRFKRGSIHRYPCALTMPGGKGVNVARALKTFSVPAELMGFAGGYLGLWIKKELIKEGLRAHLIEHNLGESRVCYSIVEQKGISTDFNEDGPAINYSLSQKFIDAYEKKLSNADMVSLSGRGVLGLKKGFYASLARFAADKKIPFFADLSGEPLIEILNQGVFAAKINNYEFEHSFKMTFSPYSMKKIFDKNRVKGLEILIVTNRHKPFYCLTKEGFFEVLPPKLKSYVTPVGAGDSFMAGLIKCVSHKKNIKETLSFCAAAAACDCETLGAGIITASGIKKYLPFVKIKEKKI